MDDKLTVKQKKWVNAVATSGNGTQAVIDAGYDVADRRSAKSMASELLNKRHVQDALATRLLEIMPNLNADISSWVQRALNAPIKGSPEDDGTTATTTWSEKKAFLEFAAKFTNQEPVKKSAHLKATIKLPE